MKYPGQRGNWPGYFDFRGGVVLSKQRGGESELFAFGEGSTKLMANAIQQSLVYRQSSRETIVIR